MSSFLLFLEFLGTTEMLVIAVVALVVFGPRRLPEIGRTIGKHLAEFRRASEDFRRTWEREVEVERITSDVRVDKEVGAMLSEVNDAVAASVARDAHPAAATQTVDAQASGQLTDAHVESEAGAHVETDARADADATRG